MTSNEPRYPFVVPGTEVKPNQPLCPWNPDNVTDHVPYYRDVGGYQQAYSGLTTEVGTPENLIRTGAVIVVEGPPRSGKSSLINRYIHWLGQDEHGHRRSSLHVLNFAGYAAPAPSVEERTNYVAELVRTKLLPIKKQPWAQKQLEDKKTTGIESVLLLMQDMRDNDQLSRGFVIVPPPLEADTSDREIERYRSCVPGGVICLLEHVTGHHPSSSVSPTRLSLRHLEPGEAYQVVEKWPDTITASPPILKQVPPILQDVMVEFEEYFTGEQGGKLSTGMLLATLREVYRRRIRGTSQFLQVDSIELQEVLKTMLWVVANQSSGRGNPLS